MVSRLVRDQEASSSNLDTPTSSAKSEPSGNLCDWGCVRICHSVLGFAKPRQRAHRRRGFALSKGLQGIPARIWLAISSACESKRSVFVVAQTRCLLLVRRITPATARRALCGASAPPKGSAGGTPATRLSQESLVCYTCCGSRIALVPKAMQGYGGTPSPQQVYEEPAHR